MTALMASMRRHWGLILLSIVSAFALGRVMYEPMPGHYRIFVSAARELLAGRNPYGTNYGTGIGNYFYSIFCAWSVFAPLSFLPEKVGVFFFVAGSWALFVHATRKLAARLTWPSGQLQLFWFLITAQIFSAVLATKLELLMVGILFWAIEAWLDDNARRPRVATASLLFATILSWKYQPLPILGLLALVSFVTGRRRAHWALVAGATVAFSLAPYLVYPWASIAEWNRVWSTTFEGFIRSAFLNFENLYACLYFLTGYRISLEASQVISGLTGGAIALGLALYVRREGAHAWRPGALLALAWGACFVCVFSPLGQNNAMVLYAPLLFVSLGAAGAAPSRAWSWLLGATWFFMTWSYSDLFLYLRLGAIRDLQIKPLMCLALAGALALQAGRRRPLYQETGALSND